MPDAIRLDPTALRQEMVGFGGALTESSAWVLAQLPSAKREEILHRYFDPRDGIGYMVRKHGLTIDSLLAAEIVTANGDIVVADESHHTDLFWALHAAQELGCDDDFDLWTPEYGWWLEKRKNNLPKK
mgnify:CR=1 FL=1